MPHTKHQLQQLLGAAGLRPQHQHGQNFLIDLNLMHLLVDAAEITPDDCVLEVGCGAGSMTQLLAERAGAVVAVEIDLKLADIAQAELADSGNVQLIRSDVLRNKNTIAPAVTNALDTARASLDGRLLLVANLPYHVAGPLMINLLTDRADLAGMFVTVQAEVAQRMAEPPGSKAYGILSILLQALGDVELLRTLPPQAFWPAPQVRSAMAAWRRNSDKTADVKSIPALRTVIDTLLRHRRKKVSSCVAGAKIPGLSAELLDAAGIDRNARAETLPPEIFVTLANLYADVCDTSA